MLRRALATSLILLLLPLTSYSKRQSPTISYPDFKVDDGNSQLLTQKEEDQIVRFVKTVQGIDHRVQEIEVKSHDEVEVKTGAINPLDFKKYRHGDRLFLRKSDSQWAVVERSSWSLPASQPGIFIADGTANLQIVANVIDAATRKPVSPATVSAIRGGRGTTLLASDSTAMPPPEMTDRNGRAVLHANFRSAADSSGSCVFVARSFLRVRAPGYRPSDVRISAIGRLDFGSKTKHPTVTIPVTLVHE